MSLEPRFGDLKPKHFGGYSDRHSSLCERTLVTLLDGLGPWKQSIYLVGGLVPRYLIRPRPGIEIPPHAGTMDVDLVVNLDVLAEIEAYRKIEVNLKSLGFERAHNDDGRAQHFRWTKLVEDGIEVAVDLLSDATDGTTRVISLPGEQRLSALALPGAHLVIRDFIEVVLKEELLDNRGIVTETIRVANIVPYIVLKALAFDERGEEKDAHDLIYCLDYFEAGPKDVAAAFGSRLREWKDEPLLTRSLTILRERFASDKATEGARKNGPVAYARFQTEPGRQSLDAANRQHAAATVELLLNEIKRF